MKDKNAWTTYDKAAEAELEALCGKYRRFLDQGKTERECVALIRAAAEEAGYRDLNSLVKEGKSVAAGDKVYAVNMGKMVSLFHIGSDPMQEGFNILGAHIDSPRLDVKQNPLYEDTQIAYLDTHYYGGIKKYQWVTIPMAIHGVVVKTDGTSVPICIGEDENDPVVFVSDLLIHLAASQMDKKARVVIEGEALDKPKQFNGTSIVVKTENDSRAIVEASVKNGWEPHFVVAMGDIKQELRDLATMLDIPVEEY